MVEENQSKNIILEQGFEKLAKEGAGNFTVESLASNLGMSKKTIYKFFPTKELLIEKMVTFFTGSILRKFQAVTESDNKPVEKFEEIMSFLINKVGYLKMENAMEMKARYPNIWKMVEEFRLDLIHYIAIIFREAQSQGYAKSELDMDVVAIIYMNIINSTFQPEFFIKNNLAPSNTISTFVKMVTEGIFLDKEDKTTNHNKLIWES